MHHSLRLLSQLKLGYTVKETSVCVRCRVIFWTYILISLLAVLTLRFYIHRHPPTTKDVTPEFNYKVPNIVHYIWYPGHRIRFMCFHHMLSILSAHRFLKPDRIYFHTNREPRGRHWKAVKQLPTFKVVHREPPTQLFGKRLPATETATSQSNIDHLLVLRQYGGIYLDLDVLVTRSFDPLRVHECTLGYETDSVICGGVIVCSNQSEFLSLWLADYANDYQPKKSGYNTGLKPTLLALRYSDLVHIEPTKLHRPNWKELDYIIGAFSFPWRLNYAVHLWNQNWRHHGYKVQEANCDNIKRTNSTYADIARHILYNTTYIMPHGPDDNEKTVNSTVDEDIEVATDRIRKIVARFVTTRISSRNDTS